jgi:hypothetical protein
MVSTLQSEGWLDLKYPPEVLRKEWLRIKNAPLIDSMLTSHSWQRYGFFNITHFMPIAKYKVNGVYDEFSLSSIWWHHYILYRAINNLVRFKRDITRASIIKKITRILSDRYLKITGPMFYRYALQKYVNVQGKPVLDLSPSWGMRALATVAEGGDYFFPPNYVFAKPLQEMINFVGGQAKADDGRRYHLIMVNDFLPIGLPQLLDRIKSAKTRADNVLAIFKKTDQRVIFDNFKPKQMIDLRRRKKFLVII